MAQISWRSVVLIGVGALAVTVFVALPLVVLPIIGGLILAATLDQLVEGLHQEGLVAGRGVRRGSRRKHHRDRRDARARGDSARR